MAIIHEDTGVFNALENNTNWQATNVHKMNANGLPLLDNIPLVFGTDSDMKLMWNNDLTSLVLYDSDGSAMVIEIKDMGAVGYSYTRFYQTRAFDAASQCPILDLVQSSDGEAFLRIIHGNRVDVGGSTYDDLLIGYTNNDTTHDPTIGIDNRGMVLGIESLTSRILISKIPSLPFTIDPGGRVEIRGTADEVQLLLTGHSTQNEPILKVQNSVSVLKFHVTKDGDIYAAGVADMPGLPTSDPAVAGRLWVDTTDSRRVKSSAG